MSFITSSVRHANAFAEKPEEKDNTPEVLADLHYNIKVYLESFDYYAQTGDSIVVFTAPDFREPYDLSFLPYSIMNSVNHIVLQLDTIQTQCALKSAIADCEGQAIFDNDLFELSYEHPFYLVFINLTERLFQNASFHNRFLSIVKKRRAQGCLSAFFFDGVLENFPIPVQNFMRNTSAFVFTLHNNYQRCD